MATKTPNSVAALRAALAAYCRENYGTPITQLRSAWLEAPSGTGVPFEALDIVNLYDSLT